VPARDDRDEVFEGVRARWPGVTVEREHFDAWVRERAPDSLEGIRVDELYLTCACALGQSAAIATFQAEYFRGAELAVRRFAVTPDEVRQELSEHLFVAAERARPRIAEYSGRGGLERWVRAVAVRLAINLTRARKDQPHETLADDSFFSGEDVEMAHLKELYRAAFKVAFGEALTALEPELQSYLRLYYLDDLTLAELAQLFGVSAPTASRRLAQARQLVLEGTKAALRARLSIDELELSSIMRLIQSKLSLPGDQGV
jgi:RNA polymerase sigma-70 factor, ECF subfamily